VTFERRIVSGEPTGFMRPPADNRAPWSENVSKRPSYPAIEPVLASGAPVYGICYKTGKEVVR
jgi:hypothetical protein